MALLLALGEVERVRERRDDLGETDAGQVLGDGSPGTASAGRVARMSDASCRPSLSGPAVWSGASRVSRRPRATSARPRLPAQRDVAAVRMVRGVELPAHVLGVLPRKRKPDLGIVQHPELLSLRVDFLHPK